MVQEMILSNLFVLENHQHAQISSSTVIQCEENVLYILFLWHCCIRSNPAALINFIVILKRTIAQFFNLKIELFPFPNFVINVKYMHATLYIKFFITFSLRS